MVSRQDVSPLAGAVAVAGNCDCDKDSERRKGGPRPCVEANPGCGVF